MYKHKQLHVRKDKAETKNSQSEEMKCGFMIREVAGGKTSRPLYIQGPCWRGAPLTQTLLLINK